MNKSQPKQARKTTFKHKVILLYFLLFTIIPSSFASTLHCIMVTDNFNYEKSGTDIDRKNIDNILTNISRYTNMDVEKYSANIKNIHLIGKVVDNLEVDSDDVIWFYYSGHARNSGEDNFPSLFLIEQNVKLSLTRVHKKLKKKNARLTITIYDGCNALLPNSTTRDRNLIRL